MIKGRKQSGLTLAEMTVVIAIAAVMVALTIPAANMLLNSFESASGAKSMISAALSSARAIAIKEQRYAGIRFQKRYDPNDPVGASQYMIFIVYDYDRTTLANGFRAVDGIQPIKLPDSIGVMDLMYNSGLGDGIADSDTEFTNSNIFRDTTTFSIIFSPSGKLVIHDVRVRNRDGMPIYYPSFADNSLDDVFNTQTRITDTVNPTGMFLQDDYPTLGLTQEQSRNGFIIYETKRFKQAYNNGNAYSGYLNQLKPVFINPYTGTIVNEQ
ncbi:MAG: prepilin-type N-terminal cleavage/methylation domain-containing protein [Sedimentisphaerales bacterium]|jgi:prepilin-type N-terminal cleavage/methylation domain-containing protein